MNKKQNKKLIPELRFPEFKNSGEWVVKKLGEVAEFLKGKGLAKKDIVSDGKNLCIHYGELFTNYSEVIKVVKSYTNIQDGFKSKINDVLMPTSDVTPNGLAKASCIKLNDIILGGDILIIRPKPIINGEFLSRFIRHNEQEVLKLVNGTTVFHLYGSSFQKFILIFPSLPEQQKIAALLSNLDELIAAHKQKLQLLKQHKKGLMQKLFPQEGEKVPKWRFPEFKDSGEWVVKKLGEVAEFINGRAYKQDELLSKGKYRVLRVGNFFTNTDWYYSNLELDEDKYCERGDLLYAWSASFGPHIWNEEKVVFHYHIWKVKNKTDINKQFLYYVLDYQTFKMKSQTLNGFALMHITKGTIENWETLIPQSKQEQQKIGECLSSLDELIAAQAEKIEQLESHKKGLMQKMFPEIN